MNQAPQMTMEERIEHRLYRIERQQAYVFEALRALGQALGCRDKIDQLIQSLQSHDADTEPPPAAAE